ncbi:MAG TPA: extracellular solute-binding protein [Ginsengibacter sp.]|nr:extracellular solute-binding protein [Ginsengibacter sp.]
MKIRNILMVASTLLLLVSCGSNSSQSGTEQTPVPKANTLIGAGATFPYPLYSKMFDEYSKQEGVRVNYQSVGSGAGIKQLQNKIVDFGASDAPMSDEELKNSPAPIIHIPTALGAVVITYNLPDNPALKFTPEVLSGVFWER